MCLRLAKIHDFLLPDGSGRTMTEHDEITFMRLKAQGNFRAPISREFELWQHARPASDGVPKFRLLARGAKGAGRVLMSVRRIADKIDFGLFKMTMVVAQRLAGCEIRRNIHRGQPLCHRIVIGIRRNEYVLRVRHRWRVAPDRSEG